MKWFFFLSLLRIFSIFSQEIAIIEEGEFILYENNQIKLYIGDHVFIVQELSHDPECQCYVTQ